MIEYTLLMTKTEIKPITVQVLDLQTSETVVDAVVTHTPPSGGSVVSIADSIVTPYINMVFGPFAVSGTHQVDVMAVGSATSPSKPVVRYIIEVRD